MSNFSSFLYVPAAGSVMGSGTSHGDFYILQRHALNRPRCRLAESVLSYTVSFEGGRENLAAYSSWLTL